MNKHLQVFARQTIKEQLTICTEAQQLIFKKMYSHDDLELDINTVVDNMEASKLDWAMKQVQRTLAKAPVTK